jgi:protein dithiol:quinone oxidoreductase
MTQRLAYFIGLILVVGILGTGYYLEHYLGIMPCPLCTLQRICFGFSGILFLIGCMVYRYRIATVLLNLLIMLISATGMFLAARQIWIQLHPATAGGDCGVTLNYMLTVLPLSDVAQKVFSGSAECTQRGWEFLYLNIPEWSLIFFALFFVCSAAFLYNRR